MRRRDPRSWDLQRFLDYWSRQNKARPSRMFRTTLEGNLRLLARVERQITVGVYQRGPRKGRPYDQRDLERQRGRASALRRDIPETRAQIARIEGGRPRA